MSAYRPLLIVTPSTGEPVSRVEMKIWLKIEEEETREDALIDSLLTMARRRYEEFSRTLTLQETWDAYYDAHEFQCGYEGLELPRAPLVSVTSIRGFTDTDATDTGGTVMNSSEYYVDTARVPGRVIPLAGYTLPTATRVANAGIVRFVGGYSSGSSGVPEQAKTTIKQMVARAYEHRGDEAVKDLVSIMDQVLADDDLALPSWG